MMKRNTTEPSGISGQSSAVTSLGDTASSSSSSSISSSTEAVSVSSPLIPRILSGSIGSIVTALAVTPLEVVKIRQQMIGQSSSSIAPTPTSFRGVKVSCPACGTLVLNNGLMECVLPIESTPLKFRSSASSAASASSSSTGGTFSTLLSIFRNEGYSGIYAGLRPTLAMSVPNTVLYFTAYDELSTRLKRYHTNIALANIHNHNNIHLSDYCNDGNSSIEAETAAAEEDAKHIAYIPLVAGSSSRLLASLVTAPLELIRTRQASFVGHSRVDKPTISAPPGMMEEFRLLIRTGGFGSLYVGVAPTLWRDVPFSALYWLFLEKFRNSLKESDNPNLGSWGGQYYKDRGMKLPPSIEALHAFVSGAAAGSIAAAFTTPFDVVKTRRQMVGGQAMAAETIACTIKESSCNTCKDRNATMRTTTVRRANPGTFGYMQQIMQQEGISGLWKGNLTRMVKVAPACAIMISCYEFGKRMFGEVI